MKQSTVTVLLPLFLAFVAQIAEAQRTGEVSGVVVHAENAAPLRGVTIRVIGKNRTVTTRADGSYRIHLDEGSYELRTAALGFAPVTRAVTISAGNTATLNFSLSPSAILIDEVTTIGSRGQDRTQTSSPVPIDVVTSARLESTGLVETWQGLQRLIPSVNVPRVPLGDSHLRSITLRSLGPDQVLVLVNGKRRHAIAGNQGGPVLSGVTPVDVNAIPTSAIERIEVLRDGAAAQYGSDAIAGVVNVVLKAGDDRSARLSLGESMTSEGGRTFHDGKILSVETTYGLATDRGAHLTLSAEYRDRDGTNRAYPDARPQYFSGDPRNSNPAVISSVEGDGSVRGVGFFLNGDYPATKSIVLYGFGGITTRDGTALGPGFRRANETRTVRAIYPDGFLPEVSSDILDFSGLGGARGSIRGWSWDLSSILGGNSVRNDVHNSNNVTLGNASPTDFYGGTVRSRQWTTNFDLSRSFETGFTSPLNVAIGGEFRRDSYSTSAGDSDSYRDGGVPIIGGDSAGKAGPVGSQGLAGMRPIDEVSASRSSVAAYLELDSRPIRRLLLDVAGRAEHYSDHGATSDGKLAARFDLLHRVALRAALGTGFRTPSLSQSFATSTRGIIRLVNGVSTPYLIRTLPVSSPEAQILGAKPLRPETSRNRSVGLVIDFPRFPVVTADYYAIDVADRIVPSGELTDASVTKLFEQNGLRGIAGGRYYTNAVDTKTRGVDVIATHAILFGSAGLLRLTGGYNHTRTRVTRISPAPPQLAAFQSVFFNRAERGKIEAGQPRETITLTANYSVQRFGLNFHNQKFGRASLLDIRDPTKDQVVGAKWITDLGVSFQVAPRLSLLVSVNNLFDVYPDEWIDFKEGVSAQGMSMSGIFRYPGGISPFGMNGRTVYFHISYR